MPKTPEIVRGYCLRCGDSSEAGPRAVARAWDRMHNADPGADTECIVVGEGQRVELEEPFLPNTLAGWPPTIRTRSGVESPIVDGWIDGTRGIFFRTASGEIVAY